MAFTQNHLQAHDLFYPTAAPTSILIAKAHVPHPSTAKVFMARISNDGFTKLKGRRVHIDGSQLPRTVKLFHRFSRVEGTVIDAENATIIDSHLVLDGCEWSPQQWLPQPVDAEMKLKRYQDDVRLSLYRAVTAMPELADCVLEQFTDTWKCMPEYPLSHLAPVSYFFDVVNGRSRGEKNYREGSIPYVSSGDQFNSIIRLIDQEPDEVFASGGITVTAFGQAYIQPWPFMARGNGGSSVRVLVPRYKMSFNDLIWFAAQINAQKWRFFYARMAIKSRLERLEITSPARHLQDSGDKIATRIQIFKQHLFTLSAS